MEVAFKSKAAIKAWGGLGMRLTYTHMLLSLLIHLHNYIHRNMVLSLPQAHTFRLLLHTQRNLRSCQISQLCCNLIQGSI